MKKHRLYLWSDSEIVLAWLEKPPHAWKTYIANRTSQILDLVGSATWRHVASADNPADLVKGVPSEYPQCDTLTHLELQKAKVALIASTQTRYFSRDITLLRESKPIDKKSSLLILNPFLDTKGLLRANGRLANSSLTYNERHPLIIPEKSRLATLLLNYIHLLMLHAEHRLMQHIVRQEFYIPRLKPQIKKMHFHVQDLHSA
nr:uncharacterized protein LOC118680113 [Bactrocera oleae]